MPALYETAMVDMPQVGLPFATDAQGEALYETMVEGTCVLGDGREEEVYNAAIAMESPA